MFPQQDQRRAIERAPRRRNLLQHVHAIRIALDHPADAAQLPLRAIQARQDIALQPSRPRPGFEPGGPAMVGSQSSHTPRQYHLYWVGVYYGSSGGARRVHSPAPNASIARSWIIGLNSRIASLSR